LKNPKYDNGSMAKSAGKLAHFLISVYSEVRQKFSVDEHRHYLFTPRDITQLIFNILRYDMGNAGDLIECLIYEG
jgi:dynein heavy chain 2